MSKKKAIVCTILYIVVVLLLLTLSNYIRNDNLGISLYQLIMYAIAGVSISISVEKFYNWLIQ